MPLTAENLARVLSDMPSDVFIKPTEIVVHPSWLEKMTVEEILQAVDQANEDSAT
jgi:hypothetical protein